MFRIILVSLFIIAPFVLNAQNKKSDDLSTFNKVLYDRLIERERLKEDRVNRYLQQNRNVTRYIYNNGTLVKFLSDVIDGKPIYISQNNQSAATATKTTALMSGGSLNLDLDGTGITVGVWEVNIPQQNHVEFFNAPNTNSRITLFDFQNSDGTTNESNHATHVIGTIAAKGVDQEAMGMAPNVAIKSYNAVQDLPEMLAEASQSDVPLLISNHSYGVPPENNFVDNPWVIGAYTEDARLLDEIVKLNPYYLSVHSAGNSGNFNNPNPIFNGLDKLTLEKTSKNALIIANANPILNASGALLAIPINPSSSQGPTDDLRIKPDLAADGTNLYSSIPGNSYGILSGTSMAAPNTSGTLALLQQYYFQLNNKYMYAATLKALVCHTATDDSSIPGPDHAFGHGFLNAEFAANTITNALNGTAIIEENTLNNGETYSLTFNAQAGDQILASLCWTDNPGEVAITGVVNDDTPKLVNDLDIRISKDGTTHFPWVADVSIFGGFTNSKGDNIRDNYEKIAFVAPSDGEYLVTISHKGTLEGFPIANDRTQDYSLLVTGNNLTLSSSEFGITNKLEIFPNPSNKILNINFETFIIDEVYISLFDSSGRQVMKQTYLPNSVMFDQQIDISNLSKGLYLLTIEHNNSRYTTRIIKD
jgi:hypothetical protein